MSVWEYRSERQPNIVARIFLVLACVADLKHWRRTRQVQYFDDQWVILIGEHDD